MLLSVLFSLILIINENYLQVALHKSCRSFIQGQTLATAKLNIHMQKKVNRKSNQNGTATTVNAVSGKLEYVIIGGNSKGGLNFIAILMYKNHHVHYEDMSQDFLTA